MIHAAAPNSARTYQQRKGPTVSVISRNDVPNIEAVHVPEIEALRSGSPGLAGTPVTYSLLRNLLAGSGIIEEREAQKMDRAIRRLLDR
jgi:hypothetical protein